MPTFLVLMLGAVAIMVGADPGLSVHAETFSVAAGTGIMLDKLTAISAVKLVE